LKASVKEPDNSIYPVFAPTYVTLMYRSISFCGLNILCQKCYFEVGDNAKTG